MQVCRVRASYNTATPLWVVVKICDHRTVCWATAAQRGEPYSGRGIRTTTNGRPLDKV